MKKGILTLVHDDPGAVTVVNGKPVYNLARVQGIVTTPRPNLKTAPRPPVEPYHQITDVPVPLRHTLRRAFESGLTVAHLVQIFELPEEWVQTFVSDPESD